jgi:hypothetical protein
MLYGARSRLRGGRGCLRAQASWRRSQLSAMLDSVCAVGLADRTPRSAHQQ